MWSAAGAERDHRLGCVAHGWGRSRFGLARHGTETRPVVRVD